MTSTIREILVEAQQRFGPEVAVRYKVGKNQIEDKTYNQLRQDSESFPAPWPLWASRAATSPSSAPPPTAGW